MVILLAQVGFGAFKTSVRFTSFTQTVIVPQKQPSHGPKTFCESNLTLRITISALVLRNRARDDNSRCYLQRTCLSPLTKSESDSHPQCHNFIQNVWERFDSDSDATDSRDTPKQVFWSDWQRISDFWMVAGAIIQGTKPFS